MTRRRSKVGGKRAGAGRKPRAGVARDVGRTLWLTPAERDAQDAAAARAGSDADQAAGYPAYLAEVVADHEPSPGYEQRAVDRAKREGVLPTT